MPTFKRSAFIMLLLALSACSNFQRSIDNSTLADFSDNIGIEQWNIKGKVGIRDSQQKSSAYLNWRQCGDNFNIRISGLFGAGAVKLEGNKNRATLFSPGEDPIETDNPQQLLSDRGWPIPVTELFHWVLGLPDPRRPHSIDPIDTGFFQSGWSLSFPKTYAVDNKIVPGKAIIQKQDLKLTLLLRSWDLQPDCEPGL